jgi:carboxyl-terminal processing protease
MINLLADVKNIICTRYLLITLLLGVTLTACREKDEDPVPVIENAENQYVNAWILQNMEYWYLWNEFLPGDTDKNLDPADYFTALIYEDDRFSWIQDDYQELLNSLNGINKEAGYEFVLYRETPEGETVIAQILYVKPSSPASTAGLQRGDVITKINGTTITTSNYKELIKDLKEPHTLDFKKLNVEEKSFSAETTVSLSTLEYQENPNHLSKVIETNGRKIGYYVYNFFASGKNDQYDLEMDDIFNTFKSESITDLVLDLRFNSGGSEVSSKNLASLIAPDVNTSDVFFKREYNDMVTEEILNTASLGEKFLTSNFLAKTANIGNQLSGNRVYILTSSRTASASELIINTLKPYMEVFLIGDVTYGKNVGSISIYEEDDPMIKWGIQPIVTRVSNSEGFSEYSEGFQPDLLNKDNGQYIYPLGDTREALLAEAIAQITGVPIDGGRIGTSAQSLQREVIGHSLDEKRRGFELVLDKSGVPVQ